MRARLAIASSGVSVELREVVLRDKPANMLEASPKATVPVLVLGEGKVLEESLDVMDWALGIADPESWLDFPGEQLAEMRTMIAILDGPFKSALDRYKYENRYDGVVSKKQRDLAVPFLRELNERLAVYPFLFGEHFSFADGATLPFVRQFAHVDRDWFWAQDWPHLIGWLDGFLASDRFATIMTKYPQWHQGDEPTRFGGG
jgi:glutathione S-transferase